MSNEQKTVTLKINGRDVTVPSDYTVIQAAEELGIHIPRYCYHPYLSSPGVCRMCLVKLDGIPKLQPACKTPVREGLQVTTNSKEVKEAVREVLEFTLINHPLDCPICDQAGECGLHDYYHDFGLYNSQFFLPKVHKPKRQKIGPTLMLDAERCILCTRCVRFCEEITETNEMAILDRGDHSVITAVKPVENPYSVNLADICPVGALTEINFRFKLRVWYLQTTESICPGCARGCNVLIDHYRDKIYRIRPRENPEVNAAWMCDHGRTLYKKLYSPDRIIRPMVKKNGGLNEIPWSEAISKTQQILSEARGSVVAQISPLMSNEDAYSLARLLEFLNAPTPASPFPGEGGWEDDKILRRADRTPNRYGVKIFSGDAPLENLLEKATVALIVHGNSIPQRDKYPNLETVIFIGTHQNETSQNADIVLPITEWAEYDGTFVNFQGRLQRFKKAVSPPEGVIPPWELFTQISAIFSGKVYSGPEEVFQTIAKRYRQFRDLEFEKLGDRGVPLPKE